MVGKDELYMALLTVFAGITWGFAAVLSYIALSPKLQAYSSSGVYSAVSSAFGVMVGILWIAFGYFVVASIIAGGIIMAIANAAPILRMFGVPIPTRIREEQGFSVMFSAVLAWAFASALISALFPSVFSALPPISIIANPTLMTIVSSPGGGFATAVSGIIAFGLLLVLLIVLFMPERREYVIRI
mgnify:FL=1